MQTMVRKHNQNIQKQQMLILVNKGILINFPGFLGKLLSALTTDHHSLSVSCVSPCQANTVQLRILIVHLKLRVSRANHLTGRGESDSF